MWKCPKCGRRFARPKQAHSCRVVPLRTHLDKVPPKVRAIYRAVMRSLRACGPVQVAPTRSGINLLSRTSLGGIRLHRSHASLGLVLTRRLDNPRVASVFQISPRSFLHKVVLHSTAEVDAELRGWLREAYQVGLLAGRRP
jgi:hypothetical protein